MSKNKTENGNAKGFKRMVLKNTRFGTRKSFVKKMCHRRNSTIIFTMYFYPMVEALVSI